MKLNDLMLAQMREATQLLQTSGPAAATAAIQRALQGCSMPDMAAPTASTPGELHDINPRPAGKAAAASGPVPDISARIFRNLSGANRATAADTQAVEEVDADVAGHGKFLSGTCTNQAGTRAYKLYVPSGYSGQALPLIVMLHGCKQNPDDFAAGTGMNTVAEQNNCFVVYPGQIQAANGSNCWNWFQAGDQQRHRGEPSIIADITRDIIRNWHIDARRVYVAGLSAGGAMAAIMGMTYPELYAAVGIHSGLPYGAAHDVASAFAAMKNGMKKGGKAQTRASRQPIPVIVFHGDRDSTVHPCNGEQALAQCMSGGMPDAQARSAFDVTVQKGRVPQGREYTTSIQHDGNGKAIAEQWVVHGAGHAWSGGSSKGSYTDPKGPDASREMLRFFYTHTQAAQ